MNCGTPTKGTQNANEIERGSSSSAIFLAQNPLLFQSPFVRQRLCKTEHKQFASSAAVHCETGNFNGRTEFGARPSLGVPKAFYRGIPVPAMGASKPALFVLVNGNASNPNRKMNKSNRQKTAKANFIALYEQAIDCCLNIQALAELVECWDAGLHPETLVRTGRLLFKEAEKLQECLESLPTT
jgi:hypothetical protein